MAVGDTAETKQALKNLGANGMNDAIQDGLPVECEEEGHIAHTPRMVTALTSLASQVVTDPGLAAAVDALLPLLDARYAAHA